MRDERFMRASPAYQRHPKVGDVGVILEVYTTPEAAFEVECSDPHTGNTIWLEAMFPEELELK